MPLTYAKPLRGRWMTSGKSNTRTLGSALAGRQQCRRPRAMRRQPDGRIERAELRGARAFRLTGTLAQTFSPQRRREDIARNLNDRLLSFPSQRPRAPGDAGGSSARAEPGDMGRCRQPEIRCLWPGSPGSIIAAVRPPGRRSRPASFVTLLRQSDDKSLRSKRIG